MGIQRPGRARGKVKLGDEEPPAAKAVDSNTVLIEAKRTPVMGKILRALIGLIVLLSLIAAALYVIAVTTVAAFPTIDGATVLTVRGAHSIGQYPAGELAVVSQTGVDRSPIANLEDIAGIPGAAVVKIGAGPYGQLTTDETGQILVDGGATGVYGVTTNQILDGVYVATCVAGPCGDPGSAVFVPQNNIIGVAKGIVSAEGLTPIQIPSPQGN